SIPCSPECKIVGQILLDHLLSYALTATVDVPTVYLQQFWRTVSKIHSPEDTIKFMLNTQEFIYTVDMFRYILHLPVETLENPFVAPVNIKTIEAFMNRVGYQGVVDKVRAFYTKNLAQPWQTMFKMFNRCLTTRTSGNDQTKINILQMFHVMINQTNVDYAALLWWDFMNNVNQKKEAIQDDDIHSQRHDDHQEDDAPPKGEKRVKRHKISKSSKSARGSLSKHSAKDFTTYVSNQQQQQEEWDAWVEETVIDEDEVILEDETLELIIELQDVNKRVPTIYDYARMKATLNNVLSN
ncbi:hypothetical protein Tco_1359708, partial [Tanacetum coccineum]